MLGKWGVSAEACAAPKEITAQTATVASASEQFSRTSVDPAGVRVPAAAATVERLPLRGAVVKRGGDLGR